MKTIYLNSDNTNGALGPFDTIETAAISFDQISEFLGRLPEDTIYRLVTTNTNVIEVTTLEMPKHSILTCQNDGFEETDTEKFPIFRFETIIMSEGCEIKKLNLQLILNEYSARFIDFNNSCALRDCNLIFYVPGYQLPEIVAVLTIENRKYVTIERNNIELSEDNTVYTYVGDVIAVLNSNNVKIIKNYIDYDFKGDTIRVLSDLEDFQSYNIKIFDNIIRMTHVSNTVNIPAWDADTTYNYPEIVYHNGKYWQCISTAHGVEPSETTFEVWQETTVNSMNAISVVDTNTITIFNNAIRMLNVSEGCTGISVNSTPGYGEQVVVKNNYIEFDAKTKNMRGIFVNYDEENTVGSYEITNNLVFNSGETTDISTYAYNVSIVRTLLDYNAAYNFDETNVFTYTGSDVFDNLGSHSIINYNPFILYNLSSNFNTRKLESYAATSYNFRSAGYDGLNIGIAGYFSDYYSQKKYFNIIDNVLYDFGRNPDLPEDSKLNIVRKNNAQTDRLVYDNYYRYYNSHNIDNWVYTNRHSYPFSAEDINLYDKDLQAIINNKELLQPFLGILSPPNPGAGSPDYDNYQTGLFGTNRRTYSST